MNKTSADKIFIRDLLLRCVIGIYPEERTVKQDILLNIVLEARLAKACHTDDIHDTVDYKRLKKQIMDVIEASEFMLIERLAEEVADICLRTPGVLRVTVTVDKPGALRFARSVAVEITRSHDTTG